MRIDERTLQLPALYIIDAYNGASTSDIKNELISVFHPTGEDATILNGRNDTKFTQIVRNLLGSHYQTNGMADYTTRAKTRNSKFYLTDTGKSYLDINRTTIEYLFDNKFKYDDVQAVVKAVSLTDKRKKTIYVYSEEAMVSEGKIDKKETVVKKRSKKLRDAAISHYSKKDGTLHCAVCDFVFENKYGSLGKGFIEIHHEEPLYQYSDDGFESYVSDAIEKLKPVCPNCHRMLHRDNKHPLSVSELKKIII